MVIKNIKEYKRSGLFLLALTFFSLSIHFVSATLTEQENANATLLTGPWTSGASMYDGNWGTSGKTLGDSNYYFNYTKPSGATNDSFLELKDSGGQVNLTYSQCWDAYSDVIAFKFHNFEDETPTYVADTFCWDGSSWDSLRTTSVSENAFYEEKMWWNITLIETSETWTPGGNVGTYKDNVLKNNFSNIEKIKPLKSNKIMVWLSDFWKSIKKLIRW